MRPKNERSEATSQNFTVTRPGQTEPMAEIPQNLIELDEQIKALKSALARLRERLIPVLSTPPVSASTGLGGSPISKCDLGRMLGVRAQEVRESVAEVNELAFAVEL